MDRLSYLLADQGRGYQNDPAQRAGPLGILRALAFLVVIVLLSTTRIPLPWLYRQLWPSGIWPFWIGAAVTVVAFSSPFGRAPAPRQQLEQRRNDQAGPRVDYHGPLCPGPSPHLYWHSDWVSWHRDRASQVRGVIGFVLIFAVLWAKLSMEEKWMRSQFGETYSAYAHQTAAPVPYLF